MSIKSCGVCGGGLVGEHPLQLLFTYGYDTVLHCGRDTCGPEWCEEDVDELRRLVAAGVNPVPLNNIADRMLSRGVWPRNEQAFAEGPNA